MKKATIKIKRKYFDTELQRLVFPKESLDVSLERAKIICDKGLGDVVEVNHHPDVLIQHETQKNAYYGLDYDNLTVKELKQIAKEKDIKTTGLKKQELIDKLLECK